MSIKKLVSPKTKGINVSNERVESLKINEIIDHLNTDTTENGLVFFASLQSQSGTNDPEYTVIKNTINDNITIVRDDVGTFFITSVGSFTENKTICEADNKSADTFGKINIQRVSNDLVTVETYDAAGVISDTMILNNWIKITVYP